MFLQQKVMVGNDTYFYGFELIKTGGPLFVFTDRNRRNIIQSIINHVNVRINFDSSLHKAISSLVNIDVEVQQQDAKCCHSFITPDFDEQTFLKEYHDAAELLKDLDCDTPLKTLHHLCNVSPDSFPTMKIALARVVASKPHSADVE